MWVLMRGTVASICLQQVAKQKIYATRFSADMYIVLWFGNLPCFNLQLEPNVPGRFEFYDMI